MNDCKNLLPEYLRFVKGVVDSSDLPLNVSREILQENPQLEKIKKGLVNKILSTLKDIKKNEPEKYLSFYKEFGPVLKEGLHYDYYNKEKISDLLLFETTKTAEGELRSWLSNRKEAAEMDLSPEETADALRIDVVSSDACTLVAQTIRDKLMAPVEDPGVRRMWQRFGSPRAGQSLVQRLTGGRPGPWGWWPVYVVLAVLYGYGVWRLLQVVGQGEE